MFGNDKIRMAVIAYKIDGENMIKSKTYPLKLSYMFPNCIHGNLTKAFRCIIDRIVEEDNEIVKDGYNVPYTNKYYETSPLSYLTMTNLFNSIKFAIESEISLFMAANNTGVGYEVSKPLMKDIEHITDLIDNTRDMEYRYKDHCAYSICFDFDEFGFMFGNLTRGELTVGEKIAVTKVLNKEEV